MLVKIVFLQILGVAHADGGWWKTEAPEEYQCALKFIPEGVLTRASNYQQLFLKSLTKELPDYWGTFYGGKSYNQKCHDVTSSVAGHQVDEPTTTLTKTNDITYTLTHSGEQDIGPMSDKMTTIVVATHEVRITVHQFNSHETSLHTRGEGSSGRSTRLGTPIITTSGQSGCESYPYPIAVATASSDFTPDIATASDDYSNNPFGPNPFGSNPFGSNPFGSSPFGLDQLGTGVTRETAKQSASTNCETSSL